MNISELARQLNTEPQILREKLPKLGFHIGSRAIQIDDATAPKAITAWKLYKKREALKAKFASKKKNEDPSEKLPLQNVITIPPSITVSSFAKKLNMDVSKVIVKLMQEGVMAAMNQKIDYETAAIVAEDLGIQTVRGNEEEAEQGEQSQVKKIISEEKELQTRPPVVVVMGHVDHGKTSLLDAIRQEDVASQEAGAITQHIGAYQVSVENTPGYKGKTITFIDTPGHEAFTGMRSRGGKVADIAVLVIAADDKIQPQTIESIEIIQKEGLSMIVAINKIDKPDADVDKIKTGLAEMNLAPEDWGGDTICVPLSAKARTNIDQLLENILLLSEVEDLKANLEGKLCGTIIESRVDKGLGPVATAIIQNGTLKVGMLVKCGSTGGKVKGLQNDKGQSIKEACPSMPVRILGLKNLPEVGDVLIKTESLRDIQRGTKRHRITSKTAPSQTRQSQNVKYLKIYLKTDVLGTLEALEQEILKIKYPEAEIKIVKKGLGAFTESDALEAEAEKAFLVGFKVSITPGAEHIINSRDVHYKNYTVIYQLLDDLVAEVKKLIPPEIIEEDMGKAKVLALFGKIDREQVVGGVATEGRVIPDARVRIFRDEDVMSEGKVVDLQYNRHSAKEIKPPQEFGVKINCDFQIKEGDELQFFTTKEMKKT